MSARPKMPGGVRPPAVGAVRPAQAIGARPPQAPAIQPQEMRPPTDVPRQMESPTVRPMAPIGTPRPPLQPTTPVADLQRAEASPADLDDSDFPALGSAVGPATRKQRARQSNPVSTPPSSSAVAPASAASPATPMRPAQPTSAASSSTPSRSTGSTRSLALSSSSPAQATPTTKMISQEDSTAHAVFTSLCSENGKIFVHSEELIKRLQRDTLFRDMSAKKIGELALVQRLKLLDRAISRALSLVLFVHPIATLEQIEKWVFELMLTDHDVADFLVDFKAFQEIGLGSLRLHPQYKVHFGSDNVAQISMEDIFAKMLSHSQRRHPGVPGSRFERPRFEFDVIFREIEEEHKGETIPRTFSMELLKQTQISLPFVLKRMGSIQSRCQEAISQQLVAFLRFPATILNMMILPSLKNLAISLEEPISDVIAALKTDDAAAGIDKVLGELFKETKYVAHDHVITSLSGLNEVHTKMFLVIVVMVRIEKAFEQAQEAADKAADKAAIKAGQKSSKKTQPSPAKKKKPQLKRQSASLLGNDDDDDRDVDDSDEAEEVKIVRGQKKRESLVSFLGRFLLFCNTSAAPPAPAPLPAASPLPASAAKASHAPAAPTPATTAATVVPRRQLLADQLRREVEHILPVVLKQRLVEVLCASLSHEISRKNDADAVVSEDILPDELQALADVPSLGGLLKKAKEESEAARREKTDDERMKEAELHFVIASALHRLKDIGEDGAERLAAVRKVVATHYNVIDAADVAPMLGRDATLFNNFDEDHVPAASVCTSTLTVHGLPKAGSSQASPPRVMETLSSVPLMEDVAEQTCWEALYAPQLGPLSVYIRENTEELRSANLFFIEEPRGFFRRVVAPFEATEALFVKHFWSEPERAAAIAAHMVAFCMPLKVESCLQKLAHALKEDLAFNDDKRHNMVDSCARIAAALPTTLRRLIGVNVLVPAMIDEKDGAALTARVIQEGCPPTAASALIEILCARGESDSASLLIKQLGQARKPAYVRGYRTPPPSSASAMPSSAPAPAQQLASAAPAPSASADVLPPASSVAFDTLDDLADDQLVQSEADAKRLIDQRHRMWTLIDPAQKEVRLAAVSMTQRLSTELYTVASHFLYELIQNADDASYPDDRDATQWFDISSTHELRVSSNEYGFRVKDVKSITSAAASTKEGMSEAKTGHKGIGWKSVFLASARPQVHSGHVHLVLDVRPPPLGLGPVGQLAPQWIDPEAAGVPKVTPGTTIILPLELEHKAESNMLRASKVEEELEGLFDYQNPHILLYLRRLKMLGLRNTTGGERVFERLPAEPLPLQLPEGHEATIQVISVKEQADAQPTLHRWLAYTARGVQLAFPLGVEQRPSKQFVYCVLPVKDYGLKFAISAPFVVPSTRETVTQGHPHNLDILHERLPEAFSASFEAFSHVYKSPSAASGVFLSFLPLPEDVRSAPDFEKAAQFVARSLGNVCCLPTASGHMTSPAASLRMPAGVTSAEAIKAFSQQFVDCGFTDLAQVEKILGKSFVENNNAISNAVWKALGVLAWDAKSHAITLISRAYDEPLLTASATPQGRAKRFVSTLQLLRDAGEFRKALSGTALIPITGSAELAPLPSESASSRIFFTRNDKEGNIIRDAVTRFRAAGITLENPNLRLLEPLVLEGAPAWLETTLRDQLGIQLLGLQRLIEAYVVPAIVMERNPARIIAFTRVIQQWHATLQTGPLSSTSQAILDKLRAEMPFVTQQDARVVRPKTTWADEHNVELNYLLTGSETRRAELLSADLDAVPLHWEPSTCGPGTLQLAEAMSKADSSLWQCVSTDYVAGAAGQDVKAWCAFFDSVDVHEAFAGLPLAGGALKSTEPADSPELVAALTTLAEKRDTVAIKALIKFLNERVDATRLENSRLAHAIGSIAWMLNTDNDLKVPRETMQKNKATSVVGNYGIYACPELTNEKVARALGVETSLTPALALATLLRIESSTRTVDGGMLVDLSVDTSAAKAKRRDSACSDQTKLHASPKVLYALYGALCESRDTDESNTAVLPMFIPSLGYSYERDPTWISGEFVSLKDSRLVKTDDMKGLLRHVGVWGLEDKRLEPVYPARMSARLGDPQKRWIAAWKDGMHRLLCASEDPRTAASRYNVELFHTEKYSTVDALLDFLQKNNDGHPRHLLDRYMLELPLVVSLARLVPEDEEETGLNFRHVDWTAMLASAPARTRPIVIRCDDTQPEEIDRIKRMRERYRPLRGAERFWVLNKNQSSNQWLTSRLNAISVGGQLQAQAPELTGQLGQKLTPEQRYYWAAHCLTAGRRVKHSLSDPVKDSVARTLRFVTDNIVIEHNLSTTFMAKGAGGQDDVAVYSERCLSYLYDGTPAWLLLDSAVATSESKFEWCDAIIEFVCRSCSSELANVIKKELTDAFSKLREDITAKRAAFEFDAAKGDDRWCAEEDLVPPVEMVAPESAPASASVDNGSDLAARLFSINLEQVDRSVTVDIESAKKDKEDTERAFARKLEAKKARAAAARPAQDAVVKQNAVALPATLHEPSLNNVVFTTGNKAPVVLPSPEPLPDVDDNKPTIVLIESEARDLAPVPQLNGIHPPATTGEPASPPPALAEILARLPGAADEQAGEPAAPPSRVAYSGRSEDEWGIKEMERAQPHDTAGSVQGNADYDSGARLSKTPRRVIPPIVISATQPFVRIGALSGRGGFASEEDRHAIGREGERYVLEHLKAIFDNTSGHRLKAVWVNEEGESFEPYDIKIVRSDGQVVRYVEVKTTSSAAAEHRFPISASEVAFCQRSPNWDLCFVTGFKEQDGYLDGKIVRVQEPIFSKTEDAAIQLRLEVTLEMAREAL